MRSFRDAKSVLEVHKPQRNEAQEGDNKTQKTLKAFTHYFRHPYDC
jgi:hypothetical protein